MKAFKLIVAVSLMMVSASSFAQSAYDGTADKALTKQIADNIKIEKARQDLLKTQLKANKSDVTIQNELNECTARIKTLEDNKNVVSDAIKAQTESAKQLKKYESLQAAATKAKDAATKANEKADAAIKKAEEARQKATTKAEEAKAAVEEMKAKADQATKEAETAKKQVDNIREMLKK